MIEAVAVSNDLTAIKRTPEANERLEIDIGVRFFSETSSGANP
jgi:hypothetical protein